VSSSPYALEAVVALLDMLRLHLLLLLLQMVAAFKELPELARIAVDPFLNVRSKANIVNAVLKDSGATEITKRLFGAQQAGNSSSCSNSSGRNRSKSDWQGRAQAQQDRQTA
jgi:hypothetical protein